MKDCTKDDIINIDKLQANFSEAIVEDALIISHLIHKLLSDLKIKKTQDLQVYDQNPQLLRDELKNRHLFASDYNIYLAKSTPK